MVKRAIQELGGGVENLRRVVNQLVAERLEVEHVRDVELPDATVVRVPHGLGRRTRVAVLSVPVGAVTTGRIGVVEADTDSTALALRADGWGATITIPLVTVVAE